MATRSSLISRCTGVALSSSGQSGSRLHSRIQGSVYSLVRHEAPKEPVHSAGGAWQPLTGRGPPSHSSFSASSSSFFPTAAGSCSFSFVGTTVPSSSSSTSSFPFPPLPSSSRSSPTCPSASFVTTRSSHHPSPAPRFGSCTSASSSTRALHTAFGRPRPRHFSTVALNPGTPPSAPPSPRAAGAAAAAAAAAAVGGGGGVAATTPTCTVCSGHESYEELLSIEAVFNALRQELTELRANGPAFVLRVGALHVPPVLVGGNGELFSPCPGMGPWDVEVILKLSDTDPIYSTPLRATLRFPMRWPAEAPEIRVDSLMSWPLLRRDRTPPGAFYKSLERDEDGKLSIVQILEKLREFLLNPLPFVGLDSGDGGQEARRSRAWLEAARKVNTERMSVINQYTKQAKHPELFDPMSPLRPEWFDPAFWAAHEEGSTEGWKKVLREEEPGEVYSMPIFTEAFCDFFLEEVFAFYASGLPARRPNSMNNYGIVLNDIGLEHFVDKLQAVLQPIGRILFPGAGSDWDGHHCFIVRYRENEDLGLDMHTDDSDVTFNICLGLDFDGAGLQFCGTMGQKDHRQYRVTYKHERGRCIVHLGRKRHGADDITRGERMNLILWNHSTTYRKSNEYKNPPYVAEGDDPDLRCLSYTHDRDFGAFKPYPEGKDHLANQAWCPPRGAEYPNFGDRKEKSDH